MNGIPLSCYHICYDEQTKKSCPSDFIPLFHENEYPDFKEIFPIISCLSERTWEENEFIGFFSPKFAQKTGFSPRHISDALSKYGEANSVILFTSFWESAAYWLNPWEQAEYSNPGVLETSQILADRAGFTIDLMSACVTLDKTVFSHFLVAGKSFWDEWLRITKIYLELISSSKTFAEATTNYRDSTHAIHPFIIERVPTLINMVSNFSSVQFMDLIYASPDLDKKKHLFEMNQFKREFNINKTRRALDQYWEYRLLFGRSGDIYTQTAQHFLRDRNVKVSYRQVSIS